MSNRYAFTASPDGDWRVISQHAVIGDDLPRALALSVAPASAASAAEPVWTVHGLISNIRYATKPELTALRSIQAPLGRHEARCAALIPIRKTAAWWTLAQDERRAIFEETSHHTAIGMDYLPAVARQLFHSRDLGEPFDFLTWFEFAPSEKNSFDDLVGRLRATTEWTYVEREIDIRLER